MELDEAMKVLNEHEFIAKKVEPEPCEFEPKKEPLVSFEEAEKITDEYYEEVFDYLRKN